MWLATPETSPLLILVCGFVCRMTRLNVFGGKVIETRKFALTPGLTPKELVQEAEMLKRVDHEYIIKLEDIFQVMRGHLGGNGSQK